MGNNKYEHIINDLVHELNNYEKDEFTIDDVISCLLSNKFYYKLNDELITNINSLPINKKILYDIPNIKITNIERIKLDKFINKYNNIINNVNNIHILYYNKIIPYINIKNKLIYKNIYIYINSRIIYILSIMIEYKILKNDNISIIIDKILKNHKTIYNYIKNELQ
jgi:hypothetical protein